jgi:hypothetical protein
VPSVSAASAALICFNHSHGGTSGRKCRANGASDVGSEKKSEAFMQKRHESVLIRGPNAIETTDRPDYP